MAENANKYHKITHVQHVLTRPDTYIGSIEKEYKELYIFNEETQTFKKKTNGIY